MNFPTGSTSKSIDVRVVDDSGLPVTGLVASTFPSLTWSLAGAHVDVILSKTDLATIITAYTSGGIKERGGGVYRLDLPDAMFSTAGVVTIRGETSGKRLIVGPIEVGAVPTPADITSAIAASGQPITVVTPVDCEAGEIVLNRVDDYSTTTGQWIEFDADDFPEFPEDGVVFRALRNRNTIFDEVECTRTVTSATRQNIKCFLTNAQVAELNIGAVDDFRFKATYGNGETRTVWHGKLNVTDVGE